MFKIASVSGDPPQTLLSEFRTLPIPLIVRGFLPSAIAVSAIAASAIAASAITASAIAASRLRRLQCPRLARSGRYPLLPRLLNLHVLSWSPLLNSWTHPVYDL